MEDVRYCIIFFYTYIFPCYRFSNLEILAKMEQEMAKKIEIVSSISIRVILLLFYSLFTLFPFLIISFINFFPKLIILIAFNPSN